MFGIVEGINGLEPARLCALKDAVPNEHLRNLHSVVVLRHGSLVFEQYFNGRDEHFGTPVGNTTFDGETLHDVRSITKSIISMLYGIAFAHNHAESVSNPILDTFTAFADLRSEPDRMKILVKHALTMTMGTKWNETLPYDNPKNGEYQMEEANDRYRYILDRPLVKAPGECWNYNGGATAVLAELVSRATSLPLLKFAKKRLFEPLGITHLEWITDEGGEPLAASGLRLRPRDLAKIGQLMLNQGRWAGRELVPASWIHESTKPHVRISKHICYGYQWWLGNSRFDSVYTPLVAGFGNGGQGLHILPELDLVVVVTAGNYNDPKHRLIPTTVLNQFVLPAICKCTL